MANYKYHHRVTSDPNEYISLAEEGYVDIEYRGDRTRLYEELKNPDGALDVSAMAALAEETLKDEPKKAYQIAKQFEGYDIARIYYILGLYFKLDTHLFFNAATFDYLRKAIDKDYIPAIYYYCDSELKKGFYPAKIHQNRVFQDLYHCLEEGYGPALYRGGANLLCDELSAEYGASCICQAAYDEYTPSFGLLGYLHELGIVMEKEEGLALDWYHKGDKLGDGLSKVRLFSLGESKDVDFSFLEEPFELMTEWFKLDDFRLCVPLLKDLVELYYYQAFPYMGFARLFGFGDIDIDEKEAVHLFQETLGFDIHNVMALAGIYYCKAKGIVFAKDPSGGLEDLQSLPLANWVVFYLIGKLAEEEFNDETKALEMYRQAFEWGYAPAYGDYLRLGGN